MERSREGGIRISNREVPLLEPRVITFDYSICSLSIFDL